jgi:sulfatase modifying factor 1
VSCCSDIGGHREAPACTQDTPAPPVAAPPMSGQRIDASVARIHFKATTGHVGTDKPVIAEDGEGPRRAVKLRAFDIEATTVTNARFAEFVSATGFVTETERFGWSPVFHSLLAEPARHPSIGGQIPWWVRVDAVSWRHPEGPDSTIDDRADHPVVQVSFNDATAFAAWCGGRLPTEAEWEHAARAGVSTDPRFPWGDGEPDDETVHCNIWQGRFPEHNTLADGYLGTSPVEAFAPNAAGLYGMSGNVWEWTADPFRIRSLGKQAKQRNELATRNRDKVVKGGSFLCHKSYCYRYRIVARSSMSPDSATSHTGFRICYDARA